MENQITKRINFWRKITKLSALILGILIFVSISINLFFGGISSIIEGETVGQLFLLILTAYTYKKRRILFTGNTVGDDQSKLVTKLRVEIAKASLLLVILALIIFGFFYGFYKSSLLSENTKIDTQYETLASENHAALINMKNVTEDHKICFIVFDEDISDFCIEGINKMKETFVDIEIQEDNRLSAFIENHHGLNRDIRESIENGRELKKSPEYATYRTSYLDYLDAVLAWHLHVRDDIKKPELATDSVHLKSIVVSRDIRRTKDRLNIATNALKKYVDDNFGPDYLPYIQSTLETKNE